MMELRNIRPDEAESFWKLRLEALHKHPEAFGASYEEAVSKPLSEVEAMLEAADDRYVLGAFMEDGQLAGTVGFYREKGIKFGHKGMIWGVYVSPEYRGQGIARKLFEELLDRGKRLEGLQQINLWVVTTNRSAVELYAKLGFETYGIEKNALVHQGQGYDEALMCYDLRFAR
ncbi:GNAT family N-acetyltransferase [Paenibacillus filicis]|uniref:GNAT family N-acetyltransferase n=1 Tax=Paenibacillus filicis TaxID=669464 RepID=A0ABU9DFJ3_9BACL